MMAEQELQAIENRTNGATTGPWVIEAGQYSGDNWLVGSLFVGTDNDGKTYLVHVTTDHVHASELESDGAKADAEFIAHAREDIPALLEEVRRLQAENNRLKINARFDIR